MAKLSTPQTGEYNPYYQTYINYIDKDAFISLDQQQNDLSNLLESLTEEELNHRYEEGKWSIREVIVHIIDTERVFAYRSLSVSRGEERDHMGFDQNDYMDKSDYSHLTGYQLLKDFNAVRSASISLFENMTAQQVNRMGEVSGGPFKTNSGAYIIAGHFAHHMKILKERYL